MARIIHLETVELRNCVLIRPAGQLGNCGPVPGSDLMWSAVCIARKYARDTRRIRNAWNNAHPSLLAGSVNAPAIEAR